MAEPLRPAGGKLYGRDNWVLVQTVASATGAPSVAEMAAASSLDITRIAFASSAKPTPTTATAESPKRIGDTDTYEFVASKKYAGGELRYAINDQAATGSDEKKLYEKILAGGNFRLINRRNLGRAAAVAAGQFVHSYPIELGTSDPIPEGDAEGAESGMVATFAITGPPAIMVAVLA